MRILVDATPLLLRSAGVKTYGDEETAGLPGSRRVDTIPMCALANQRSYCEPLPGAIKKSQTCMSSFSTEY